MTHTPDSPPLPLPAAVSPTRDGRFQLLLFGREFLMFGNKEAAERQAEFLNDEYKGWKNYTTDQVPTPSPATARVEESLANNRRGDITYRVVIGDQTIIDRLSVDAAAGFMNRINAASITQHDDVCPYKQELQRIRELVDFAGIVETEPRSIKELIDRNMVDIR